MTKGILIGIAGGSGSGKTLVARKLVEDLGSDKVIIIEQDSYYKDLSHLSLGERKQQNFDHPDALDKDLLLQHMTMLIQGQSIDLPLYDFKIHTRRNETRRIGEHIIIILEGILILHNRRLRDMMDIKIFVDTADDIRLIRRLQRDIIERGREFDDIIHQYEESVRPMHLLYVEPSKRHADIIIPEGGYNLVAIDILKTKIESILRERGE
ncbi:MAG: uridine kinase [candidate division KSB1 bacterium]|jgi:uridine kinase|nr:uridine kinase [candidate division KSB1 bacterium]